MAGDLPITDVRGSEFRCSGHPGEPHKDVLIQVPADKVVVCPHCGRRFQRSSWWNVISGAIWPHTSTH